MHTPSSIQPFLHVTLDDTHFDWLGKKYQGKVRDVYDQGSQAILIATDRQSAFDIAWCTIPLKGQVLNQMSTWWFEHIKDIAPIHVLSSPDPNVTVVKTLKMLKVEIVVRGYLTGSTGTSAWVNYNNGMRNICGNMLPDGMKKNTKFASPILTPTTKSDNDELIDPAGIIERGLATKEQWQQIEDIALTLFLRGQEIAARRGLILVDTKYEMGFDADGKLTIGDEVHTPDSSRYWVADTYEKRLSEGLEPESLDKEFFRLWLKSQGFDYGKPKPQISDDVRLMLAAKYIELYERMTGTDFVLPPAQDILERIGKNVEQYRI
ncbi:MAG: phosphoribosylaminoimidazolesuccinocarboxamide synthase [Candidatus Peribacteraceae bacterium]|nr:phosphoribosylaminoimidazolesuccinocarboxamide synthase [Candidatus Peribacteraceae bacterium]